MHRGGAGVAEKIEKAFPLGQFAQHRARGAMVEKQSGVEVVGEVHEKTARTFAHLVKCAGLVELFVLPATFLAATHLEEHLLARDLEHQRNYPERVLQALARL